MHYAAVSRAASGQDMCAHLVVGCPAWFGMLPSNRGLIGGGGGGDGTISSSTTNTTIIINSWTADWMPAAAVEMDACAAQAAS